MSDASPVYELGPPRPLREKEAALIRKLVSGTPFEGKVLRQLSKTLVQDMLDGSMGSVHFCKMSSEERRLGKEIAEGSFRDADGVLVSVTLNLDQFGDLFELDIWKVDFSPLIGYPDPDDFEVTNRHGRLGW